jgi:hypothetical protein
MHCNRLPFLDDFVQHDENTLMVDGANGTTNPSGDNQMTNEGDNLFIYLPYCILPSWFGF